MLPFRVFTRYQIDSSDHPGRLCTSLDALHLTQTLCSQHIAHTLPAPQMRNSRNSFPIKSFRTLCKTPGIGYPFTQSVLREGPHLHRASTSFSCFQKPFKYWRFDPVKRLLPHSSRSTSAGDESRLPGPYALRERKINARIAHFCATSPLLATHPHFMGGGG
jgi:hypothetical protein